MKPPSNSFPANRVKSPARAVREPSASKEANVEKGAAEESVSPLNLANELNTIKNVMSATGELAACRSACASLSRQLGICAT